ncbi:uncharacterized protein DS421_3g84150 [Arachis hypogaea]|nr:uncharacterized protein DS421_3g84150 [Arachis hypogaea]
MVHLVDVSQWAILPSYPRQPCKNPYILGDEATLRMKTAIRIAGSDYSELKALVDLKAETVWRSLPFVP